MDSDGHKISFSGSGNETRTAVDPDIDSGSSEVFSVYWETKSGDSWDDYGNHNITVRPEMRMKYLAHP